MEVGMTIDVLRAGLRIEEIEIDLRHRATGSDLGAQLHRASNCATSPARWRPAASFTPGSRISRTPAASPDCSSDSEVSRHESMTATKPKHRSGNPAKAAQPRLPT